MGIPITGYRQTDTVELLGVVVEDSEVVEDAVERRRELAMVDPVGEEVDELQLRGHEAEAAREPVPRQGPVCYRRRLLRARSSRRGEPSRRRGKLRESPGPRWWMCRGEQGRSRGGSPRPTPVPAAATPRPVAPPSGVGRSSAMPLRRRSVRDGELQEMRGREMRGREMRAQVLAQGL